MWSSGAAAACLLLAGALLWLALHGLWPSRAERPEGIPIGSGSTGPHGAPRATPFLAGDAIRQQPAWSPAGNLIAYVSDEAGKDDIWICDPSGANQFNLTATAPGASSHPAWSPDGQRIAFYSDRDGGGIYTMTALGGSASKIIAVKPGILYAFSLRWARNGALVYTDFDDGGEKQVYCVSESDRTRQCLTAKVAAPAGHFGELSTAGNLLVFLSPEIDMTATLYVGDLRTGKTVALENGVGAPRWDPRGDRIYFLSRRDGLADLWSVDINATTGARTGTAKRLTSALDLREFSFAPDGVRLITVKTKNQSRIWSFPVNRDLLTDLATGRPLTAGGFVDVDPCTMPDGKSVLFSSNRREGRDIWKLAPGSTGLVRLTTGAGEKYFPRVSPDGRWVCYGVVGEKGQFLHVMRADGSDQHLLEPHLLERFRLVESGHWAPDGLRLACNVAPREGKEGLGVAVIDPETGIARKIDLLNVAGERPAWSPDGRFLAYETVSDGSWDIWLVTADGRNPRRLTSSPSNERSPVWSRDGKFLYFIRDNRGIWRLPMDAAGQPSGEPRLWAQFPKTRIDRYSLCFFEDQAVMSISEEASDLWLVQFVQP